MLMVVRAKIAATSIIHSLNGTAEAAPLHCPFTRVAGTLLQLSVRQQEEQHELILDKTNKE